jgi:drug/metabolite transporter (DMT)-like permease
VTKVGDDRTALTVFFASSILAGGNAVAIRFSNRELDPLWGAGFRFALATVLLAVVMFALRLPLPRGRAFAGSVLYGVFSIFGAFALAYYGLVELHAGLGQTLLALVPLATLFLAVLQRQERLRAAAVVGGAVALGGIAVMSNASVGTDLPLLSIAAVIGSAFCFAEASVLVRRLPPVHPIAMNFVGMAAGAALLLLGALIAGQTLELPDRSATWLAIGYVVPLGSVLVFVLYLVLLRFWSASRASFAFVVIPVVTLILSAWLDDEPISLELVLGGLLVLSGVYVGALRSSETIRA